MLFPCVIPERREESGLRKRVRKKIDQQKNLEAGLECQSPENDRKERSEEKTEHRFAEILRLQQLPLRMTERRRHEEKKQEEKKIGNS